MVPCGAFLQERATQERRVDPEKAKGEHDKPLFISDGSQKQVGVRGPESMMKLRQFELMLDTVAKFANALPDVLTAVPPMRKSLFWMSKLVWVARASVVC
jgi:hypothetical protein